jgi:hypothetical protein
MVIKTRQRTDHSTVTTLTGRMMDQAELTGVINSLYELQMPIFKVEVMAAKEK